MVTKQLLKTVYLTLQQHGYKNVSLKKENLLEYVPKIEKILDEKGLLDSDLFIKTPVEETYDQYKNFLIEILIGERLGYFNERYDTIILNCNDYYIYKNQTQMDEYKDIINECCYAIIEKHQVINCANCDNEYSKEPFMCNGCNESYPHDYKKFKQKKFIK